VLLGACVSPPKPQITYVEKIVEVKIKAPEQLRELCAMYYLETEKPTAEDVIVLANKMKNSIAICNEVIKARNKFEDK
jgi:hypothetical protein